MREYIKAALVGSIIICGIFIGVHLLIGIDNLGIGNCNKTFDYAIELQKDGTVYVKTDHGLDTTLVTLDSLEAFITADNL